MATPIRIKRSAVAGKRPALDDIQLGELALNTTDAELLTKRYRAGIGTDIVRIGAGVTVSNVIYVTKDGKDNNTGLKLGDAKATVGAALTIATTGSCIRISPGLYEEDNPLVIPEQVSVVGDSLREISIQPKNQSSDLFHVANGNYFGECSFIGTMTSGNAIFAFNPTKIGYIDQSPYIRNCTNFVKNSIGLKIDGSKAVGPFKAMVLDSFTQYNENGIGVSLTNEGYAQLVSMFTICNDIAVYTGTGGACDLTNSNSSFGNYGMVSDGVGPEKYVGIITSAQDANKDEFTIDLSTPSISVTDAVYTGATGIVTVTTNTAHGFGVGMGISFAKLGFTCSYGDYTHTFVSAGTSAVDIVGGGTTSPSTATYDPNTGNLVLTLGSGHGLSAATSHTISTATYTPTTGILSCTISSHGFSNGDRVKIVNNSLIFTCGKDGNATPHSYPRISDPINNKWVEVSNVATNTFDIDVGVSPDTSTHALVSASNNGLKKAVSKIGIATESLKFTCSKDSHATQHDYPRTTDPVHNETLGLESVDSTTVTVNVGVSTNDIFPNAINPKFKSVFEVVEVPTTKSFSAYVGVNTRPHNYVEGGKVKVDIQRPFDGQVIYFDNLYKTVKEVVIGSAGTGYSAPPTVTFSTPSESWGVKATGVANINALDGSLKSLSLVSSGRGYTSTPTVTISSPDSGINTATVTATTIPSYSVIESATPISSGICTVTVTDNVPYAVGVGSTVPFFKQSKILASSHSFEYIGAGVTIGGALPAKGGTLVQDNEVKDRNGGLTIFTSTDQSGNFRIGDGVIINQQTGKISGAAYSKSLFSQMTPFILALGGD